MSGCACYNPLSSKHQQTEAFKQARRQHPAIESAINALEVHGLNLCPDHGIVGFKRYVALAVLARNLHRLGDIVWQQEQERGGGDKPLNKATKNDDRPPNKPPTAG